MSAPHNVSLICDGAGWTGSFGIALEAFVEDILSDGAPFDAWIEYEDEQGERQYDAFTVIDCDGGRIYLKGDEAIEIDSVRRFSA